MTYEGCHPRDLPKGGNEVWFRRRAIVKIPLPSTASLKIHRTVSAFFSITSYFFLSLLSFSQAGHHSVILRAPVFACSLLALQASFTLSLFVFDSSYARSNRTSIL